jgi:hypothetical protein
MPIIVRSHFPVNLPYGVSMFLLVISWNHTNTIWKVSSWIRLTGKWTGSRTRCISHAQRYLTLILTNETHNDKQYSNVRLMSGTCNGKWLANWIGNWQLTTNGIYTGMRLVIASRTRECYPYATHRHFSISYLTWVALSEAGIANDSRVFAIPSNATTPKGILVCGNRCCTVWYMHWMEHCLYQHDSYTYQSLVVGNQLNVMLILTSSNSNTSNARFLYDHRLFIIQRLEQAIAASMLDYPSTTKSVCPKYCSVNREAAYTDTSNAKTVGPLAIWCSYEMYVKKEVQHMLSYIYPKSTNHKSLSIMYLMMSLYYGMSGICISVIMRYEIDW